MHWKSPKAAYWGTMGLICIFWLVPILYIALLRTSPVWCPKYFHSLQRVSCLFEQSVDQWHCYYYQIKFESDSDWFDVNEELLSSMPVFGHQTRLSFLLDDCQNAVTEPQIHIAICEYIKRKCESADFQLGHVTEVRIIRGCLPVQNWPVQLPGGWAPSPLEDLPLNQLELVIHRTFPSP